MMEGIIRPFQTPGVTPTPFTKPGAQQNVVVRVGIGFNGSIKTLSTSYSASITTKMGQAHHEKKPKRSPALTKELKKLATPVG